MLKQKQYNVAETNIANLGSDLEKKVRLAAAQGEEQWKGAGKVPGIQIWRIKQFKVVPVPPQAYGTFYAGDSYILLHTAKKPGGDALIWDIHFWLGKDTTQDEAGTAAYKTVELDDFLGGGPVEFREVQGFESSQFMSYFKNSVKLLEGGFETGFHHVGAAKYEPRLLQFKGKKHIRVTQVPMALSSVNSGDCFLLDLGKKVVQFNGAKSRPMERQKVSEVVRALDDERNNVDIVVYDEGSNPPTEWVEKLGKGPIPPASAGGSDEEAELQAGLKILFRLSDASGTITFTKVAEGPAVTRNKLDSSDVFILDTGDQVWAWIGRGSSAQERKNALQFAQDYLKQAKKPAYTPISRVLQGGENEAFEQVFHR